MLLGGWHRDERPDVSGLFRVQVSAYTLKSAEAEGQASQQRDHQSLGNTRKRGGVALQTGDPSNFASHHVSDKVL